MSRHILAATLIAAALSVSAAADPLPPKSAVIGIGSGATSTNAPVTIQDGTGQPVPIGSLNPTTHSFEHQGGGSQLNVMPSSGVATRSEGTRAADIFNPRDFGAVGDGTSHTVSSKLGISTLAALASYTANGKTPYSFINQYPYGVLFNLNPHAAAASGATTINFQATAVVGVQIPTAAAVSSGATTLTVPDLSMTADGTAIANGTAVTGTGIPAGTTVSATPTGFNGSWTLTLSAATTGSIAKGALLTFSTRPASGGYSLPLIKTDGIAQGDLVVGTCIQTGTQVDWVSHARSEITLSMPTTCQVAAAQSLTFTPSWLSNVATGMQVQGPSNGAVPAGDTVASVDTSAGTVTLANALAASLTIDQDFIGTSGPTSAQPLTFYRPYTDSEAAALQVDRLGIQAAINAANAGIGGTVILPAAGSFLIDGPIIMPIFAPFGQDQATVTLGGQDRTRNGAILFATKDFGPESALISCGDPSAKATNGRGLYTGTSGYFCSGALHSMRLKTNLSVSFSYGLRPKWGGTPVAMNGIKEGPRLFWDDLLVENFNVGAQSVMDHTELHTSVLTGNFIGLRLDDRQPNLFGDEIFERLYTSGNAWAGISIAANNFLNGVSTKPYMANNPYAIYCEASPTSSQCLQGFTLINANDENTVCGIIKDGGIRDGYAATGFNRIINNTRFINGYQSNGGFGAANTPTPLGGCQWAAYFDVGYANDFSLENVWSNDLAPVANAYAAVLRVDRLDGFAATGLGGFRMSGTGVWTIIQSARTFGQNVVNGPNGFGGDFWFTGSWQFVTLEGPTFKARPMPLSDSGATTLPLGTLAEYGTTSLDTVLAVQRAGQTSGAALAGVSCQNWSGNPNSSGIAPVICFSGSRLPLVTTATATLGQILKASTTTFGAAVAAIGITDGPAAGVSMNAGTSSTLTYVKPLWAGQN